MQQWVVERGTLWALETDNGLPPACSARVEAGFKELAAGEIDDLTAAMNLPSSELIHRRLEDNRRCFILKVEGQIATYGWVTQGIVRVGGLERIFHLGLPGGAARDSEHNRHIHRLFVWGKPHPE